MTQIVTVRMPQELLHKVRELAPRQHYKDVSELMRALIRKRAPRHLGIKEQSDQTKLINELKSIIARLEDA